MASFVPRKPTQSQSWQKVMSDPMIKAVLEGMPEESREKIEAALKDYVDNLDGVLGQIAVAVSKAKEDTSG
jgi:hypothetical protein